MLFLLVTFGKFLGFAITISAFTFLCMSADAHMQRFLQDGQLLSHRLCTSSFVLGCTRLFSKVVVLINNPICGIEMFLVLLIFPDL